MRRREIIAGIGSLGVVGGASAVAIGGVPSFGSTEDADPVEPQTVKTIEAPGSESGEVRVPASDQPTFIDFFATWCPPCIKQMPALIEAHERLGDEVLFMSVTIENVGGSVSKDEVAEWWAKHDGNWTLGIDPIRDLSAQYSIEGVPYAVAIGADGRVEWSDKDRKSADELVAGIERAIVD